MEKDFKEAIEKSTKAMHTLEDKVENKVEDLNENVKELWGDLKKNLASLSTKLEGASEDIGKAGDQTTLQAHLGAMEAREKMEGMKEGMEEFTDKVTKNTQTALDTATLKAHLAKKEAEDFWEKKGKGISAEFKSSKENVEKMAVEAVDEITSFFTKLVANFSEKKH